jgi:hypothetical protein
MIFIAFARTASMLSRIDRLSRVGLLSIVAMAIVAGCAQVVHKKPTSPLAKPGMSPDSVVLEFYFVRFPFDNPEINGATWDEIDEQPFEARLRKQLAESGFRVGLIQGELPSELQKLIVGEAKAEVANEPAAELDEQQPAGTIQPQVVTLDEESSARKRTQQLRAGQRSEILASGIYDSLPLIELDQGELRGKPYPKGQGLLAVKSFPQGDGRVKIDVLPELHYGEQKVNYVGDQMGMLRIDTGRSKKVFEQLAMSATLSPGEMIVLGSLPERRGSLGHYFFTEPTGGKLDQKLLIIRLAQTQYDDLFGSEPATPAEQ